MFKKILHGVKRNATFVTSYWKSECKNYYSTKPSTSIVLEHVKNRAILKLKGEETEQFLQGLITNDMKHLKDASCSMYTMFLNSKGRVLVDSIIYRTAEKNTFLIEIDISMISRLESHLRAYILRKKIEIANLQSILQTWVLFDLEDVNKLSINSKFNSLLNDHRNSNRSILIYKDPRSFQLGLRCILSTDVNPNYLQKYFDLPGQLNNTRTYKSFRYQLGVGEGPLELPSEKSFPLEVNGDYLHGVSFQKGCYLGQELTARTYHLGVIRKRLMPLFLKNVDNNVSVSLNDSILCNQDKSSVGKLRGIEQNYGLGLLRVENVLKCDELIVGNLKASTTKPNWWPIEATKEPLKETA